MNIYIAALLCVVPYVLCFIGIKLFSKAKLVSLISASVLGLLAVLPISFLEYFQSVELPVFLKNANTILVSLLSCFIICGLIEEAVKMLFFVFVPKKNVAFGSFVAACFLGGLCVGCFENIVYLLLEIQKNNARGGNFLYLMFYGKRIAPLMIHAFCSGLCGIYLWSVINKQADVLAFIFAVLMHGIYDFFAQFDSFLKYFAFAAVLFAIIELRIRYSTNKPVEIYKKDPVPAKDNKDATIETCLRDAPLYNPKDTK